MIEITENIFNTVYNEVKRRAENKHGVEMIDYKSHPYVEEHENYKYAVLDQAKVRLLTKFWNEDEFGSGKIIDAVKNSIQTNAKNNLIDWRKKDDFKKLKTDYKTEKLLFDFFKNKIPDEDAFNRFMGFGFTYQLIAYLFFIKNSQKYMPISQQQFDQIFDSLGIDFQTSGNISWENYLTYNEIIKGIRKYLSEIHQDITLLDAHGLLWMYGFSIGNVDQPAIEEESTSKEDANYDSNIAKEESTKGPVDEDELPEDFKEIDFLELHRKMMEIGELAEDFVIAHEKKRLSDKYPELVNNVRAVSKNPQFGFDIISYEAPRHQMQIEVKAVSPISGKMRFIITRNELKKSQEYPNYYIYCVSDVYSSEPKIHIIKKPNLKDDNKFELEPLTYEVKYKE